MKSSTPRLVAFLGIALLGASIAAAQSITVEKSTVACQANRWGSAPIMTVSPGADININGIDDSWTAIRIKASNGAASIGRVTLSGSRSVSTPLDVLIVSLNCLPADPASPVFPADIAASSWSGLTYASGSESVRSAVRLTAAISGDLTGSIDSGTVYRLQVGGGINAAVTAAGWHRLRATDSTCSAV